MIDRLLPARTSPFGRRRRRRRRDRRSDFHARYPSSLLLVLALAPDLSGLGYLAGSTIGAATYDAAHTYSLPVVLATGGVITDADVVSQVALIWLAHIGGTARSDTASSTPADSRTRTYSACRRYTVRRGVGTSGAVLERAKPPPANEGVSAWILSRGGRTRTCNPRFWRPVRYQLRHAPGLRRECSPTPHVTLCHEDAAVRARGALRGDLGVARARRGVGGARRAAVRGSSPSPRGRSPSGWGISPGESGQDDRESWPSRQDESAAPRRILLGW